MLIITPAGTAQGDPTEANWVGERFRRDDELLVGSVKGNLGYAMTLSVIRQFFFASFLTTVLYTKSHLEITAFLASLCKVCFILQSGVIPANVNFNTPNPAIQWNTYGLRVPLESTSLGCRGASGRSLIALTSSGIGGANGSCIVEGPPTGLGPVGHFWDTTIPNPPTLVVIGGLSPRSTAVIVGSISVHIKDRGELNRVARSWGRRSRSMPWKSFAVSIAGNLGRFCEPVLCSKTPPPLVFVFSGQGPQHSKSLFHV